MFKDIVRSQQELRAIFGQPNERAVLKCQSSLDEHSRAFIAAGRLVDRCPAQPPPSPGALKRSRMRSSSSSPNV